MLINTKIINRSIRNFRTVIFMNSIRNYVVIHLVNDKKVKNIIKRISFGVTRKKSLALYVFFYTGNDINIIS